MSFMFSSTKSTNDAKVPLSGFELPAAQRVTDSLTEAHGDLSGKSTRGSESVAEGIVCSMTEVTPTPHGAISHRI